MATSDRANDDATDSKVLNFDPDAATEDDGTDADIWVDETFINAYNDERAVLKGDTYDAKETIKFDWHTTHHEFDGDRKAWIVDADALDALEAELDDAGYSLETDVDDSDDTPTDRVLGVLHSMLDEGDLIEVEYQKKTGTGTSTFSGEVQHTDYEAKTDGDGYSSLEDDLDKPRVRFQRPDGQRMRIQYDEYGKVSLYTVGSHAPFVGAVEAVEILDPEPEDEAGSDESEDDEDEDDQPEGLPTAEDILGDLD